MHLHLLRHGATTGNVGGVFEGRIGGTLTDEQVRALRRIDFDGDTFDAIYSSPLARCVDTAAHLGINLPLLDSRLAERDLGIFEGLTGEQCRSRFPAEFLEFQAFTEDYVIPKGESRGAHVERVMSWLADTLHHECVLAITSGGTIDFIYRLSTKRPLHGGHRIYGSNNVALSSFEIRWPDIRLLSFDVVLSNE
ncbi:MAG: histidine phosphatase family protein [Pseudomonadales bacterium]